MKKRIKLRWIDHDLGDGFKITTEVVGACTTYYAGHFQASGYVMKIGRYKPFGSYREAQEKIEQWREEDAAEEAAW